MNEEKKDFEWNPPTPPWQSEPEPLSLKVTPDKDPEPVNTGLVEKIEEMVEAGDLDIEEVSKDGSSTETQNVPTILFNGKPVNSEFSEESEDENGTELDGFFFYRIKCPTGITLNGKHFEKGAYWFDEETYATMSDIDSPYNRHK